MKYQDVVNSLVREVGAQVREYGFARAFKNAPSFPKLCENEIDRARREVSAQLRKKGVEKKKLRRVFMAKQAIRYDINVD